MACSKTCVKDWQDSVKTTPMNFAQCGYVNPIVNPAPIQITRETTMAMCKPNLNYDANFVQPFSIFLSIWTSVASVPTRDSFPLSLESI